MTVSLVEILAAARAHAAPLAAESAGYLLLGVADHVVSAPRVVEADEVELSSDGSVRLRARRAGSVQTEGAERAVRRLLARALEVASSVGPALRRAAERGEDVGLPGLVRELEVALIPANRSAARRALSRLHRETERARDSGKLEALLRAEAGPPVAPPPPITAARPDVAPIPSPEPPVVAEPPPVAPVALAPRRLAPEPRVELTLTPEPELAVAEPVLTKPEPVVLRARERGTRTPQLGTVVTAQTLPGEELERTEPVPPVDDEPAEELALADDEATPALPRRVLADAPAPFEEPEPSVLPDVLTAMVELHTGVDGDEAPTRLREVVTELRAEGSPAGEPPDENVEALELDVTWTAEPESVEDEWLSQSSLEDVVSAPVAVRFESERAAPEVHDAPTWHPAPVVPAVAVLVPPALLMAEPEPEPSPYVPAVLPVRSRDVTDLLDSFYVTGATAELELRGALKQMAGLELTPMPHPLVDEASAFAAGRDVK
jgi:hypothetical protein